MVSKRKSPTGVVRRTGLPLHLLVFGGVGLVGATVLAAVGIRWTRRPSDPGRKVTGSKCTAVPRARSSGARARERSKAAVDAASTHAAGAGTLEPQPVSTPCQDGGAAVNIHVDEASVTASQGLDTAGPVEEGAASAPTLSADTGNLPDRSAEDAAEVFADAGDISSGAAVEAAEVSADKVSKGASEEAAVVSAGKVDLSSRATEDTVVSAGTADLLNGAGAAEDAAVPIVNEQDEGRCVDDEQPLGDVTQLASEAPYTAEASPHASPALTEGLAQSSSAEEQPVTVSRDIDQVSQAEESQAVEVAAKQAPAAEQAPVEEDPQSSDLTLPSTEAEKQAEELLSAATTAWNVGGDRVAGAKLARRAYDALLSGPHNPKLRSEVASSLADMLYALGRLDEALEAVTAALAGAKEAEDWVLMVKLSNNLGALYKKLGRTPDAENLHRDCYSTASTELGYDHPLALLARSNLTETLMLRGMGAKTDQAEAQVDRVAVQEARCILEVALTKLRADVDAKAPSKVSSDPKTNAIDAQDNEQKAEGPSESPEEASLRRTRTAVIRTYVEVGRLEMTAGENAEAAEVAYSSALQLCDVVYGKDSRESSGPAFQLANCLRAIGRQGEAQPIYERLYELTVERGDLGEETAVHLARALADLAEEAGDWASVDRYSTSALNSMFVLIGTKAHPVLESFYQAACRAKQRNGDQEGADALRKQFLSGMLRLQQEMARRGGRAGAQGRGQPPAKKGGKKGGR